MWKEITAGVLCACALGIGGVTAHQAFASNSEIKTDQRADQANREMTKKYNAKYRELTVDQLNKDLAKSSVDLDAAKKDATDRINNTFNTAYNNLGKDKYDQARKDFKNQLGSSFASQLEDFVMPSDGMTYSNSMSQCKIGFGKYDTATKTIPVTIAVTYKPSATSTNDANDYWTATYHVDTKTFSNPVHESVIAPS